MKKLLGAALALILGVGVGGGSAWSVGMLRQNGGITGERGTEFVETGAVVSAPLFIGEGDVCASSSGLRNGCSSLKVRATRKAFSPRLDQRFYRRGETLKSYYGKGRGRSEGGLPPCSWLEGERDWMRSERPPQQQRQWRRWAGARVFAVGCHAWSGVVVRVCRSGFPL